jgi:hypothetical protein
MVSPSDSAECRASSRHSERLDARFLHLIPHGQHICRDPRNSRMPHSCFSLRDQS